MVYTQARLDEALSAFRESKKYLERRGHKTNNLETHLERKYELRKPPLETAFAPRPALWARRDDDSDEEFDPSHGRKKKTITSTKSAKVLPKHKLPISPDDSSSGRPKRRKAKGITWAQGRRLGHSLALTFKFTKSENLEALKDLIALKGRGGSKMPHEEHVNVFNTNKLDSGFALNSFSVPNGDLIAIEKSELSAGTIVDRSVGLATPRGSISSLESLQANNQNSLINITDLPAEPVRGLRSRAVPVPPKEPKKLRSCLACKGARQKCSLPKLHPDYQGPCDACEDSGFPCRINEDDEPRMGPMDRMNAERESKKRSAEGEDVRGGKRMNTRGNIGSIFSKHELKDIGRLFMRKKDKEEEKKIGLISLLQGHNKPTGNKSESKLLLPLNTNLANSNWDFSQPPPDSGYRSSLFSSPAPNLHSFSMGNSLETAISLSDTSSPPLSPIKPTGPIFAGDHTTTIVTNWAHPIAFQHQPKPTGLPCHFCADFRYGFLGIGLVTVEVAWDQHSRSYLEIDGGHAGKGHETSRMCAGCSLERLRIRFCGHDTKGDDSGKHTLIEMPGWRRSPAACNDWMEQIRLPKTDPAYSARPTLPTCHLCLMPATFRCVTVQERHTSLQPFKKGETPKQGCGLRVCGHCKRRLEENGKGRWESGILRKWRRADAEFLFPGGLLERGWGDYLRSVGLL